MGGLLERVSDSVVYRGKKYHVDTSYDVVLLMYRLYEEQLLDAGEKILQALKLLVKNPFRVWLLSDEDKVGLFEQIMKDKIELPHRPQIGPPKKLIDFEADSDYIYASFKQAYGMDLVQERGKLQWKNFCRLLDGLPDKTKMKEVMRIRAMDIPEPTGYNQKERQNIMELKAYYALPVKGHNGKEGLDMLFATLEGLAEHG